MAAKRKVLLIGWDAADWRVIDPLMDAGLMPNLEGLVNGGVRGDLATLDPPLSPMLWTSIATGKRPYKHGILGFTEALPDGKGIRPVTNVHRKVKAIWNMLMQRGLRSHVVGWWPSHPAEPIDGIMISNFYQRAHKPLNEAWVMREGTVHPAHMSEHFAALRIHPGELTSQHIAPFVPQFGKVDQKKERTLGTIARILADCSTVHAAATWILEHEEWDLMAVYYDAIDHFAHAFMKFHPPRRPHVPEAYFDLYKDVVASAYRYHDMMLGRLLQLAGEEATVMLISDHGFHPDHLRPGALPQEPAAPAHEHGPYGIFCLRGPGIRTDELVYGASLLDITPTLLTLFGLPVGRDMDGKPLTQVYEQAPSVEVIHSWEEVAGECGMHSASGTGAPPEVDRDSLQQLIDLGYVEDPGADQAQAGMKTVQENRYYLAKALLDGGKAMEAIPILAGLCDSAPDELRYTLEWGRAQVRIARPDLAREALAKAVVAGEATHEKRKRKYEEHAAKRGIDKPFESYTKEKGILQLEAAILMAEHKPEQALGVLRRLKDRGGMTGSLDMRIGNALLAMRRWAEAGDAFRAQLRSDPGDAMAHHGSGIACLRMGHHEEATAHLLDAIGLRFHFPFAHYHLGEAWFHMGRFEQALQAYEVCLRQDPGINKARMRMARIYEEHLHLPHKAAALRAIIPSHTDPAAITVVSGLPRSGTSMMMRALAAGGLEPFTDSRRVADDNNPHGYFEHEAVKGLARDASFMQQARGKVVKVIAHLLPYLPATFNYRVIFMQRDLHELIPSQEKMLRAIGKTGNERAFPLGLKERFERELDEVQRWAKRSPNVSLVTVPYAAVIADPLTHLSIVNDALDGALDLEAMCNAVDPSLYRNRNPVPAETSKDGD